MTSLSRTQSQAQTPTDAVAAMTVAELAGLTVGEGAWRSANLPEHGVRSVLFADGPHGVRRPHEGNESSLFDSLPATCFPTSTTLGSTWNRGLVKEVGAALGAEAASAGVDVLLAPGLNLKRSPTGGRNFEYFSEDPLLTSAMGIDYITGLQSTGVGASVKHFVANDTENRRYGIDVRVDDRALRELYLAAFEGPVKIGRPATVMAAYSRLNGVHCTENSWLLKDVLRGEWGYAGAVVSDWGATWNRKVSVSAGLDIEMPGLGASRALVRSAEMDEVVRADLISAARNIAGLASRPPTSGGGHDEDAHHELALRAAADGSVLLKNTGALLPLSDIEAGCGTVAVIGAFAETPRYQGAGSSHVVPTRMSTLLGSLREHVGAGTVTFAAGYDRDRDDVDQDLLNEAVDVAKAADAAVVVVGLPEAYETEGVDRPHLRLPPSHDALVHAVLAANARTVVVLQNGSPVEMPWRDDAPAILETFLGGQAGGAATAEILLGLREPGGRLAETFPITFHDHPAAHTPDGPSQLEYWESMYLGYRYFDSAAVEVAYPFGHGLSYTAFEWSEFAVDPSVTASTTGRGVTCSVRIENVGSRRGSEVVQVYAHPMDTGKVFRADQQLVGFEKVELDPGQSTIVIVELDRRAFSFWNVDTDAWEIHPGRYELRASASSRDIRASRVITVPGLVTSPDNTDPYRALTSDHRFTRAAFAGVYRHTLPANLPARPGNYTLDTSLRDMTGSLVARRLYDAVRAQTVKTFGIPEGPQRAVVDDVVGQFTLRMLPTISAGAFSKWQINALLRLINLTSSRRSLRASRDAQA